MNGASILVRLSDVPGEGRFAQVVPPSDAADPARVTVLREFQFGALETERFEWSLARLADLTGLPVKYQSEEGSS